MSPKAERLQKDHPEKIAEPPDVLEVIAHFLLGLADLFELLIAKFRVFAAELIDRADPNRDNVPMTSDREFGRWRARRRPDFLEIALRAYVPTRTVPNKWRGSNLGPSDWTLIFDYRDHDRCGQALKFGVYQVRKGQELWEAGYFVNSEILTDREMAVIRVICGENQLPMYDGRRIRRKCIFPNRLRSSGHNRRI